MRLLEPVRETCVQLPFTGASVALTYYAATLIDNACTVELICREKWFKNCVNSMEGNWRWCAKQTISNGVCPKEAEMRDLYTYVGFAATGLMLASLIRLAVSVVKIVPNRNVDIP